MDLLERIRKISGNLKQQRQLIRSVEAAKQVSVGPFIQALGYDLSNLSEVSPNYVCADGWKCDFAILVNHEAEILIKVTADARTQRADISTQLSKHLGPPTHRIGVITDGTHYRFYAPVNNLRSVDVELIMQIDLSEYDAATITSLRYLSKREFDPRKIVHHATNVKQKNSIRFVLETNYKQPSEEFVRFFAAEIHSGVLPLGFVDSLAPLVRQVFREFVEEEHKSAPPYSTIAAGTTVEIPVFAEWRGQKFRATLVFDESHHRNSRITFDGLTATPSNTALKAIRSVVPDFKAINGWSFWKLRDPNENQERQIGDLREDNALLRRVLAKYGQ